ncbi:MAG TPA: hypothetical protein VHF69_03050, partial [Candidatus Synoicihabitans sp.]|nr:hypothetical protein [Candidatus Synoicihabitans sp.]
MTRGFFLVALVGVIAIAGQLRGIVERVRDEGARGVGLERSPTAPRAPTLLAGFRHMGADLLWLRTYAAWRRSDAAATQALVTLVSATDPETLPFWLNGARMIAFDIPAWRLRTADGTPPPRAVSE